MRTNRLIAAVLKALANACSLTEFSTPRATYPPIPAELWKTSGGLQRRIGASYLIIGQKEVAIQHFTNAIELEDNAPDRIIQAFLQREIGNCTEAIEDAKAALALESKATAGYHTAAEANFILASCYAQQEKYLLALQHAEASLAIAEEHTYKNEEVERISGFRDVIQMVLDGGVWPEDLLFDTALAHLTLGSVLVELQDRGRYQEAITHLETAQKLHPKPSGAIQTLIGHAYRGLEQHKKAIKHYTDAINIRDDAWHRVSRGTEYPYNGRWAEAFADAETALTMKPHSPTGYHSSAEAHWILAGCLIASGEELKAITHMEQATIIARAHGYSEEDIAARYALMSEWRTKPAPTETTFPEPPPGRIVP